MVKYLTLLIFFFLISGCQNQITVIEKYEPLFREIKINTAEKKTNLIGSINGKHDNTLLNLLKNWADNDIKTNGFEGILTIDLVSISTSELRINNGVRIEMKLEVDFIITKKTIVKKTLIKFKGEEFGEITGDYSLNDKEIQINNIAKKIVERLSIKLFEELN